MVALVMYRLRAYLKLKKHVSVILLKAVLQNVFSVFKIFYCFQYSKRLIVFPLEKVVFCIFQLEFIFRYFKKCEI